MLDFDQFELPPPRDWQNFQRLTRDIVAAEFGDPFAQEHGRSGFAQQGVDLFAFPSRQVGWIGVQCKQRSRSASGKLTIDVIRKEVKEARQFEPPLSQLIIATTTPRDPKLQREARLITDRHSKKKLFSVVVISWDDINDMLGRHPEVASRWYSQFRQNDEVSTKTSRTDRSEKRTKRQFSVLSHSVSHVLGLLLTCPFPVLLRWLERFDPTTQWQHSIEVLRDAKLVSPDRGEPLEFVESVHEEFFPNEIEKHPFLDHWIHLLEPLQGNCDVNLFLGILYTKRNRRDDAISTLIEGAFAASRGDWCGTYANCLMPLAQERFLRRLSKPDRIAVLNALAHCQLGCEKNTEALVTLTRMRRLAGLSSDKWAIGQCLLNSGVAWLQRGDPIRASAEFRKAIAHAKITSDEVLLGRAAYDLCLIHIDAGNLDEAERLLAESREAKRRSKDDEGAFGILLGQGELAGKRGLHKKALRFFRLAKAKAERHHNDSVLATSLLNIGISLAHLGQVSAARDAYREARKIAESGGLKRTLERALEAEAYLQLESKRATEAADLLNELAQLRCSTGDFQNAIIAMHDRGAAYFQADKKSDAHESFNAAVSLAREHNLEEWIHRCYRDECQLVLQASGVRAALEYLRQTIAAEAALKYHQVCCHLQNEVVDLMLSRGLPSEDLQNALVECEKSWRAFPRDIPGHIRLYEIKYGVCWHLAEFDGAMKHLRQMAEYASKNKRDDAELKAIAQLGCCLTDLGRFDEAEEALRYAVKLSLNRREVLTQEHVLNNLGECLRRSGDPKRAIAAFRDAEKIASASGDHESVISTAHNRALALHQCGRRRDAMRLLQWCCDSAKEQKLWHEHVRGVHGQAILSEQSNCVGDAIPRYRQAFQLATKHKFDYQRAQIALNYGSLLRRQNKLRSSLRVLEGTPDFVRSEPNQHKWHAELAQLHQQLGNSTKAIEHWTEAKNGSKAANDTDSMILAYLALVDMFIELRKYSEANREITEALRCECDDFCRASFQYQRLHLSLELGHDTASKRAFNEIKRLSEQSTDAVETLIDAYMLVGDHNWLKDKNYVEAMKAYAFAFVEAAVCGETPQISAVLSHSIMQFRILANSKSVAFLNTVEESLQKWLTKQKASTQTTQYVLGPLRIAKRFACLNMRKSMLEEVNAIIDGEFGV